MIRTFVGLAMACGLILLPATALAQPAFAAGKPLPDPELAAGTATVRVIRGSVERPAVGIDVALTAASTDDAAADRLTARTNSEGRATFSGLSPGTTYIAEATDGDDKATSEAFAIPETGGVRVLLSTVAMAAQGPMANGGRPDPRMMSGMARPQQGDPAGRITARAIQGSLSPTESHAPVGALIHLVGIAADGTITSQTQPMDKEGRVIFDDLATDGSVAYYAEALFARGDKWDRLISQPLTLPPKVGLRLMLAGHAADSPKPAIDDLGRLAMHGALHVGPGRVVVRVGGQTTDVDEVELFEVSSPDRVITRPLTQPVPLPSEVTCTMDPPPVAADSKPADSKAADSKAAGTAAAAVLSVDASVPARQVVVEVLERSTGTALRSAKVEIIAADDSVIATATRDEGPGSSPKAPGHPRRGTGEKTGLFTATLPASALAHGASLRVRVILLAHAFDEQKPVETFTSKPFVLGKSAGTRLRGMCGFRISPRVEARFSGLTGGPDKVYIARVRAGDRIHYTPPFQLTDKLGAAIDMIVYDWPAYGFHYGAQVDDKTLWIQSQLVLINLGAGPVIGTGGHTVIPLPKGFIGAEVMEPYDKKITVGGDEGLTWRGAVPPGQTAFRAVFGVPVNDGAVNLDVALPYGAMNSQISIAALPGMKLTLPPDSKKHLETMDNGRPFWVVSDINVRPQTRLVMGISGLPEAPMWKTLASIAGGAAVLGFLLWGIVGLIRGGSLDHALIAALDGKRQQLLDAIAAIDAAKDTGAKAGKRRARLVRELEDVYAELDENPPSGMTRGLHGRIGSD